MTPKVQISLDLTDVAEAVEMAETAMRAGVDWLEVGTPLILSEGMRGVQELRARYPETPIVADLKTMDGGYLEAEVMAEAGASHVVVMGQATPETVELVVRAGEEHGVEVMGDNLGMDDPVAGAKYLDDAGCDYVIHHIGYDYRTLRQERDQGHDTPLDRLEEIVDAVEVPVQAVGGLSVQEAMKTPEYGAPLVVLGAPLTIDAHAFESAEADVEGLLREVCDHVHAYGDVPVGGA